MQMWDTWRRKAVTAAALIVAGTVAGPFGTYLEMSLGTRFVYWTLAVLGCGAFMNLTIYIALTHPELDRIQSVWRLALAAVMGALPGAIWILSLEYLFRDIWPTPAFAAKVAAMVAVIGFVVGLSEYRHRLVARRAERPAPPPPAPPPTPVPTQPAAPAALFFRSLNPELGRRLISLSKQDHYLEVVTEAGSEIILKRMSDAIAELDGYPGLQIHRSHWVADTAIVGFERDGSRSFVRLIDGRRLPVSRPNQPALRARLAEKTTA